MELTCPGCFSLFFPTNNYYLCINCQLLEDDENDWDNSCDRSYDFDDDDFDCALGEDRECEDAGSEECEFDCPFNPRRVPEDNN